MKTIKNARPLANEFGKKQQATAANATLHGVEGRLHDDQPAHEPCLCFFRENGLTQRRSSTGTGNAIGFESSEENNKREMPFGLCRQNDRRSHRKAKRG